MTNFRPTSNLDVDRQNIVYGLFATITKESGNKISVVIRCSANTQILTTGLSMMTKYGV